jgi:cell division protein ZapA (FtsZ GTPase activity inhibitor)
VTIELFGQPYTFKTETEFVRAKEVAAYLLQQVNAAIPRHPVAVLESSKFAILLSVALNMANENLELKQKLSELTDRLSKKSAHLSRTLDTFIARKATAEYQLEPWSRQRSPGDLDGGPHG